MSFSPTVAGLFAGIGGIEVGLHEAGFTTSLLCEIEPAAKAVLSARFPGARLVADVRELSTLPRVDVLAAGFPCQDLSQAGRTAGIRGRQSGLVGEVFRLVGRRRGSPTWLLLENVPFMLQLDRGRAMHFLTESLEELGFRWAYRVLDTRAFGLPHRRKRVVLLASRTQDPRPVLFGTDGGEPEVVAYEGRANGFYWTEGIRGLGWAVDAVPTLKGGSTIGIPSPPALWMPDGAIVTPEIRDAERLQGFDADWTLPAIEAGHRVGSRWKLVGNAVSVPVAAWLGAQLRNISADPENGVPLAPGASWPSAAWGEPSSAPQRVSLSHWPIRTQPPHLDDFLAFTPTPLSARAARGFLNRAGASSLRFPDGLIAAVQAHLWRSTGQQTELVAS